MNILFLASWYPNRVIPFNGNFIERHAEAAAKKHNIKALHVLSDPNLEEEFEVERRTENGVDSYIVYYKKVTSNIPILSSIKKLVRFLKGHLLAFKLFEQQGFNIDIVHLNVQYPAGLIALYLKKLKGIPYVITEHWTHFLPSNKGFENSGSFYKYINKQIAQQAEKLLPVSHDLKNALISHGFKNDFKVIPNVVDTELFQMIDTEKKEKWRLIHISHFRDDHKNISGIVRVMKRLTGHRKDVELMIVGDGDINFPKSLVKQHQLEDTVTIIGKSEIQQIAKYMQSADLFVLFSNWENLPCVIIEAFSAGIPVISSNVGGISEIVNNSNGLLVEAKDEEALYQGIQQMLNHYDKYDRKAIREKAVEQFSYEAVAEAFDKVYQDIKHA